MWAFSWADLAALFGLKVETVQKLVTAGRFDPKDLSSIVAFHDERKTRAQYRAELERGGGWAPGTLPDSDEVA